MKILHLIASPRAKESQSTIVGKAIVEKLQATYPDSVLQTHNLTTTLFPHLEEVHLASFYTPADSRTPELEEAVKHSDNAIAELFAADIIVISTPIYNFGVPSVLKAWIDHIVRAGITFSVKSGAAEGLLLHKKVYLAIASGFVFTEGDLKAYDFTEPYVKAILGFIGLTDVTTFRVEGISVPGPKEAAMQKALESVAEFEF